MIGQQINMFAEMGLSADDPLEVVCDLIRESYADYIDTRNEWLRDDDEDYAGEPVGPMLTIEEYAEDLMKRHHGWGGVHNVFWSIQLSPRGARLLQRYKPGEILLSKFEILRQL